LRHITALITAYNEEQVLESTLEHLRSQGVDVYLVDNQSTDRTRKIAEKFLGRGVIGIETFARDGCFDKPAVLRNAESLLKKLPGDWLMLQDADEIRLPLPPYATLGEAFQIVEDAGCNAVDFDEFVFVPTLQAPNHEHGDFRTTMRHYYYFRPGRRHRVTAWKRGWTKARLLRRAGHEVEFWGRKIFPRPFPMRHYLCLSRPHALQKYCRRRWSEAGLARGWHRSRVGLRPDDILLPDEAQLQEAEEGRPLDTSKPFAEHLLFAPVR
jgi:glycosyltransferase involved in cell wall biosynthesis